MHDTRWLAYAAHGQEQRREQIVELEYFMVDVMKFVNYTSRK